MAYAPHENHIITHDLLRVSAVDAAWRGWLYAFMRTPEFRSIAMAAHYGHMIKHLEVAHLNAMPIIEPSELVRIRSAHAVSRIFNLRASALESISRAEEIYENSWNLGDQIPGVEAPSTISSREVLRGRRRLEAFAHNGRVKFLENAMRRATRTVEQVSTVCEDVWWPDRFRRPFGPKGTPYVSAEDLFDLNGGSSKRVYAAQIPNLADYRLKAGWILMARSGQVYGLNGSVMLATQKHEDYVVSEDLIRIIPANAAIRSGYLLMALGHPTLGRPLVVRHAYGTSVPHLEPLDIKTIELPRFEAGVENEIADLMEEAARMRSEADSLEDEITEVARAVIRDFLTH